MHLIFKFRAKCVKSFINKEQRFPEASNFIEIDTLIRNIYLGSLMICKTYWKHIYSIHNSVCLLTPVEMKITNHVIKKGMLKQFTYAAHMAKSRLLFYS
jgi:hypothetical protein